MDDQYDKSSSESLLEEIIALEAESVNFNPQDPPPEVQAFIDDASLGQLQGLLLEVLAAMKDQGWAPSDIMARLLLILCDD